MASDTSLGSTSPSATDLHDSLAEHVRNRSGSGNRRAFDEDNRARGEWSSYFTFETRDITTQSSSRIVFESIPNPRSILSCSSFRSTSSLSAKARNGVIRVLGLERSLSPPRVIQKNSSASSLIAECEAGPEGNDRLLVSDPTPEMIVDFEDPAVDADAGNTGRLLIAWKVQVSLT
jgi:hypothetical protein